MFILSDRLPFTPFRFRVYRNRKIKLKKKKTQASILVSLFIEKRERV